MVIEETFVKRIKETKRLRDIKTALDHRLSRKKIEPFTLDLDKQEQIKVWIEGKITNGLNVRIEKITL